MISLNGLVIIIGVVAGFLAAALMIRKSDDLPKVVRLILIGIVIAAIAMIVLIEVFPPATRQEERFAPDGASNDIRICSDVVKVGEDYTFTYKIMGAHAPEYLVSVTTPNVKFVRGSGETGCVTTVEVTTLQDWGPIKGWVAKKEVIERYTIFQ